MCQYSIWLTLASDVWAYVITHLIWVPSFILDFENLSILYTLRKHLFIYTGMCVFELHQYGDGVVSSTVVGMNKL